MKTKKIGSQIFIRLERGEDIIGKLMDVIKLHQVHLGQVTGLGACSEVTIGNFDLKKKKYNKQIKRGSFEITSLTGNISEMAGAPYLHVHITIGDGEMKCWGGHLNAAVVSATCELIINVYEGRVDRFRDDESGLNFWKLD